MMGPGGVDGAHAGEGRAPITVRVEAELEPLIGGFLAKRRDDLAVLRGAVESGDLGTLQATGHNLKGLGGGYGFDMLSDLGRALEERARATDAQGCADTVEAIADFLARVVVVYAEEA